MYSSSRRSGPISALMLLLITLFSIPVNAIYFYMKGNEPKCFFEELPKDTLVVGHYEVQQWNEGSRSYVTDNQLGLLITVEEVFDNMHQIASQRGDVNGKFTFTAGDSGEHRMCFNPTGYTVNHGYLKNGQEVGGIKVTLDIAIGETSNIESTDKGKIQDIVSKVKDLNGRLQDIRREQVFQREREAEFRDQSEATNARAVRWTLIQLVVLGATCAWQLSHLRAFFIKQKLT